MTSSASSFPRITESRLWQLWPLGLFAVMAAVSFGLDAFRLSILNSLMLVAVAALGYNLMFGNAGQISLGSTAFIALGAFTVVGATLGLHLPFAVAILAGGLASALLGVAIGIPSLRLGSHYLVFSTLALHFLTLFVLSRVQTDPTGWSLPDANLFGFTLGADQHHWALFYCALFVFTLWTVNNLLRQRPGRAWTAIREHPSAAAMMGIDVVFWRLAAFALSAFLFGVAGGLSAFYLRHVSIDDFGLEQAISYVVVILVGGLGSTFGSVAGAATVVAIPYAINWLLGLGILGDSTSPLQRAQFNLVSFVYGLLIVTVLLVEPGGVAAALRRLGRSFIALRQGRRPRLAVGLRTRLRAGRRSRVIGGPEGVMLTVRNLTTSYGSAAPAVDGLSIEVLSGSVVTILGPNGAGKTSALRSIAGFMPGDRAMVKADAITFQGRDIRGADPVHVARLGLSFVPERDKVFRGLTILDNLRLRLPRRRADRDRLLKELYEIFPRIGALDTGREAALLSGGERQMLALAVALAGQPSMLILDEASLGLAPVAIGQLSKALRQLRDRGTTILMAEQNIRLALDISDEIHVVLNGRVVDSGPVAGWDEPRLRSAYLGGEASGASGAAGAAAAVSTEPSE